MWWPSSTSKSRSLTGLELVSISCSLELELSSIWLSSCQNSESEHSDIQPVFYRVRFSFTYIICFVLDRDLCPETSSISGASASPRVPLGSLFIRLACSVHTKIYCNNSTSQCKPPLPSIFFGGKLAVRPPVSCNGTKKNNSTFVKSLQSLARTMNESIEQIQKQN